MFQIGEDATYHNVSYPTDFGAMATFFFYNVSHNYRLALYIG